MKALNCFTSYLSNRQQLTVIVSYYRSYSYVKDYGVTQGTLLGLILFLIYIHIYIHSIPTSLLKSRLFMFADDIALVNADDNCEELKHSVKVTYSISII